MSPKVKSTGSKLTHKGWEADPRELDHKRIKYSQIKPPKGVKVTDEMIDTALVKAQKKDPDIHCLRRNGSGDIILTPIRVHSASKASRLIKRLKHDAFRLIVNAIIGELREAKRKLKQAAEQAAAKKKEKAAGFLNDKSRTIPVPSPAS